MDVCNCRKDVNVVIRGVVCGQPTLVKYDNSLKLWTSCGGVKLCSVSKDVLLKLMSSVDDLPAASKWDDNRVLVDRMRVDDDNAAAGASEECMRYVEIRDTGLCWEGGMFVCTLLYEMLMGIPLQTELECGGVVECVKGAVDRCTDCVVRMVASLVGDISSIAWNSSSMVIADVAMQRIYECSPGREYDVLVRLEAPADINTVGDLEIAFTTNNVGRFKLVNNLVNSGVVIFGERVDVLEYDKIDYENRLSCLMGELEKNGGFDELDDLVIYNKFSVGKVVRMRLLKKINNMLDVNVDGVEFDDVVEKCLMDICCDVLVWFGDLVVV